MKIGIVGCGLIGGSLAMAAREKRAQDTVLLADRSEETLARARLLGLFDEELTDGTIASCEMILLCLYPGACTKWLKEKSRLVAEGAVVMDMAGIKREICAVGEEEARQNGFCFIGGHPMAGREVWGLGSASSSLFIGAPMIMTPPKDVEIETLSRVKQFFLSLGFGSVKITTPEEHDAVIAYTSELAHILSSAYIGSPMAEKHRGFSAGSFRDMTRVAAINAEMWSEIFLSNGDMLQGELEGLIARLGEFRDVLQAGDRDRLAAMLADGAQRKAEIYRTK